MTRQRQVGCDHMGLCLGERIKFTNGINKPLQEASRVKHNSTYANTCTISFWTKSNPSFCTFPVCKPANWPL